MKTRIHDGSAHTFGSSLRFLEVPQKVFCFLLLHFLPHFLTHLVLSDPLKKFKSPGSQHERSPIYVLRFVYIDLFILYIKKAGFGGPKFCCHKSLAVVGHFGHQNG